MQKAPTKWSMLFALYGDEGSMDILDPTYADADSPMTILAVDVHAVLAPLRFVARGLNP